MPSKINRDYLVQRQYSYGDKVIMGSYTDVTLLLYQIYLGKTYYDPGIKLEFAIEGARGKSTKVRSLFRIKSGDLSFLYNNHEIVNLNLV